MKTTKQEVIEVCENLALNKRLVSLTKKTKNSEFIAGDYFLSTADQEGYDLFEKLVFDKDFDKINFDAHYKWQVIKAGTKVKFVEGDLYFE